MGIVTDVILPLVLAFMMFTLGLGLQLADFKRVVTRPRDMAVGLTSQIILLPLVAFGLVNLWPLPPEIAFGVILIAAAPGGVTSNYMTLLARGDVALSVSLTAVTSLLSVLTIPVIVALAYDMLLDGSAGGEMSFAGTAVSIFMIVTVPVILGMLCRHFMSGLSTRAEPVAQKISTVLFVIVLAGAVAQERENVVAYFAEAGAVTLALNLIMMALAYTVAKMLHSGAAQRIAITIECGLQNGTLAIAIAVMLFGDGAYVIPAATYSLIMFATALVFLAVVRRRIRPAVA